MKLCVLSEFIEFAEGTCEKEGENMHSSHKTKEVFDEKIKFRVQSYNR